MALGLAVAAVVGSFFFDSFLGGFPSVVGSGLVWKRRGGRGRSQLIVLMLAMRGVALAAKNKC